MRLTSDRPFLCKIQRPVASLSAGGQYVLHHTGFLVVCFFDQKRVVLNSFGKWLARLLRVAQRWNSHTENSTEQGYRATLDCAFNASVRRGG